MLVEYQKGACWWLNRDLVMVLRRWAWILIKAFGLRVKDAVYAGVPLIKVEPMPVRTLGGYRAAADGYAIEGTIVFNQERLKELPIYMQVALLLKFLLCAARHQAGGDGRFDRQCRQQMKAMGLTITEQGAITIAEGGPFRRLMHAAGIEVPVASAIPRPGRAGKTTLRVWSCTCQRCRVGTKEFFATCPQCGEPFRPGDHVGTRFIYDHVKWIAYRLLKRGESRGRLVVRAMNTGSESQARSAFAAGEGCPPEEVMLRAATDVTPNARAVGRVEGQRKYFAFLSMGRLGQDNDWDHNLTWSYVFEVRGPDDAARNLYLYRHIRQAETSEQVRAALREDCRFYGLKFSDLKDIDAVSLSKFIQEEQDGYCGPGWFEVCHCILGLEDLERRGRVEVPGVFESYCDEMLRNLEHFSSLRKSRKQLGRFSE
jgi:hypothetical protein